MFVWWSGSRCLQPGVCTLSKRKVSDRLVSRLTHLAGLYLNFKVSALCSMFVWCHVFSVKILWNVASPNQKYCIRGWAKFIGLWGRAGEILVPQKKSSPRCFGAPKKSLPRCFSTQKKSLPRCFSVQKKSLPRGEVVVSQYKKSLCPVVPWSTGGKMVKFAFLHF